MPSDFTRERGGERFQFLGMKLNDVADALPPGKYPIAVNIRGTSDNSVQTRPGFASLFHTLSTAVVTDVRAYSQLFTDDLPKILAVDTAGAVVLDTGAQVGSLAGTPSIPGASMIPFRPNDSPEPWMYIANGSDYQKFSSPSAGGGAVTQNKVGIAEPQAAPDAAPQENFIDLIASPGYTQGGTAGAPGSGNRVSDTAGTVLQDPTGAPLWTVQVGSTIAYQKLQQVLINSNQFMVMDVFAALPNSLTIQSIFYFSGTTGRCVIVPAGVASEGGGTIFKDALLTTFRRGTMIVVGSEKCYVWSITEGPNGGIAIETSTTGAHTTADALTTVPAISVISATPVVSSTTGTATTAADAGGIGPAWNTTAGALPADVTVTGAQFVSNNLNITGFGLAVPPAATILGIAFTVNWATNINTDMGDNAVHALKGGVPVGPDHSSLTSGVHPETYGSNIDLWGTSWTPANVNAANFGITLGATNFGSHIRTFDINSATVQVFYSTPSGGTATPPIAGQAITDPDTTYQVTTGIGTMTSMTVPANPFNLSGASFQTEDYISLGIKIDTLVNLTELKFLLDVGDGSFTQNFFYYTIRPSDIAAAIANTVTQLATSQTTSQRSDIDAETAAISAQAGFIDTSSGTQLLPGAGQWTQVVFPLSALTRVGNDQTKNLQTLTKIQFLWNASGTINVATDLPFVFGGYQPDVGDTGAPYQYRVRPRAKDTGVVGNPSPASRYGVSPRRGQNTVFLPSAAYDPQIDTWDVFRYGGTVTEWRFIGSTPSGSTTFIDNFDDSAAQAGNALGFDNFEPWPSVDLPNVGVASVVNGTVAIVSSADTDITSYLPGTLVQLGGLNVYTLWARPTLISGMNYLLQFVENAGAGTNVAYIIQEPFIANRHLPYMWGPDASGTVFACGDEFRPGSLYFAKNYNPDSAPDSYNQEITQPAEPLMGGETLDGLSFVASSERWWALYPQPDNPSQRYNVVQQPFPRGLAAPFGHCTDGRAIYWWAKDGIWSSTDGSLTDADLHTLFPHEGVLGVAYTYNGVTVQPPDYGRAGTFRLAYANFYLFAIYQDSNGIYRTLVCDLRKKAWSLDQYTGMVATAVYHPEQQAGNLLNVGARYPELITAFQIPAANSLVAVETDLVNDPLGTPISCAIATREFDGGDVRAPKQWGDFFIDSTPAARNFNLHATPMSLGVPVAPSTSLGPSATRSRNAISVGGVVVSDFLGVFLQWADDFTLQSTWTKLRIWQASFVVQPPSAVGWSTFGTSFGFDGYMHIRQLSIAYVSGAAITVTVTSYDGQSPAPITLPGTGGAYQKTLFPLAANKGQLYKIQMTSSAPFQIFSEDCEIYVGQWGRSGPYATPQKFGGSVDSPSPV